LVAGRMDAFDQLRFGVALEGIELVAGSDGLRA
jgi:hypothetical protein